MRSKLPLNLLTKALTRAPDLSYTLLKGMARKHYGVEKDYKKKSGVATKDPMQISLRITNVCNHRCAVCGQYGKKGYLNTGDGSHLKTLPVEHYKKLVDEVAAHKPIFYVTGGEPFLYPDFMELMSYIKKKGCILSIVTNGVLLEKNAERIVKEKWDMVLVSFDGPKEVHDKCRNTPGAFDTTMKGLEKLNAMKKKYKSIKPFVLTSTTVSSVNASMLEKTFDIGKRLKPDLMVVYLSWFCSTEIGREQTKIMKKELGVTPYTWKSYAKKFTKKEAALFQNAIKRIRGQKWPFEYMVIPDLKTEDIAKYYLEPKELFGFKKCAAPFIMVDVMPNGDVTTCRDYIDVVVGNITEKPLLEIWNDKGFVKFRKVLIKKGGTLPQCSRCCGLMGF